MNEILFIGLTLLSFALTLGFLAICESLMENK